MMISVPMHTMNCERELVAGRLWDSPGCTLVVNMRRRAPLIRRLIP